MRRFRKCLTLVPTALLALMFVFTQPARADQLTVFAAASLKTALERAADAWTTRTGHQVTIAAAGSSILARQVEAGAPADIYISANTEWMDYLSDAGMIREGTRVDLLGNELVLIAHGRQATPVDVGPDLDLSAMLGDEKLAMGLVDTVPAGIYGKAALGSLGLWDQVADRVAQLDNVRAALAMVATGETPLGIVYATDAHADDNVTVIGRFPSGSHPPIVYVAAIVKDSVAATADDFLQYLRSDDARAVFRELGFKPLVGE